MTQLRRIAACLTVLAVVFGALAGMTILHPRHISHAQWGATTPIGFAASAVNFSPLVSTTGAAGTVTNTSGVLMQVDGGPVWCNGGQDQIPENNITLAVNTTYLIVYNCPNNAVYAKTAVTAPGTGAGSTNVGIPTALLFAVPGVEIPLATVVCGASTCATITDNRPAAAFPVATMLTTVTFANLPATYPNAGLVYCSNCLLASSPCSGASTGALAIRVNGAWRCQ